MLIEENMKQSSTSGYSDFSASHFFPDFSKFERSSFCYLYRLGQPFSAHTLTAEVFYGLFKEVAGVGLAVVTKEFRCFFQLFFRPHLSPFYSEVALKVSCL